MVAGISMRRLVGAGLALLLMSGGMDAHGQGGVPVLPPPPAGVAPGSPALPQSPAGVAPGSAVPGDSGQGDVGQGPFTLQTGASLVLVPATVDVKGKILYGLTAEQFGLADDGRPRPFRMEAEADGLGLSLVVVVQCSRSALAEYGKIDQLPVMIEGLTGAAPHEVALVRFGSHPELVQPFTRKMEKVNAAMSRMGPCEDGNAATLDALSYAAAILENREARNRRAILLISETRDHGSKVKEPTLIAQLGRNNIVVESFSFSPYRDSMGGQLTPGRGEGVVVFGAKLLLAAVQALRDNVPKTVARLSGGEYDNFGTKRGFEDGVARLTNRIHNYYLLSFTVPGGATEGLHALTVTVPEYPEARIRARRNYWVGAVPGGEVGAPVEGAPVR